MSSPERSSHARLYAWYVVVLLTAANVLAFIDRKIPFILIEHIKRDLVLSDTQIGLVAGLLFTLVYATMSFPLARIADRHSRKHVLTAAVGFWSLMTAAGGAAQSFAQLALTRIGLAVGEAGCTPAAHSVIADYFPQNRRALAIGVFMTGGPLGIMLGLGVGGLLADVANWRLALVAVGAAGLVLMVLLVLTLKEPQRGACDDLKRVDDTSAGVISTVRALWRRPSFRFLALASALLGICSSAQSGFAPAYLMRSFGFSTAQAGLAVGLIAGLSGAFGAFLGGWFNTWLSPREPRWSLWLPAIGAFIAFPLVVLAYTTTSAAFCLGFLIVPHVIGTLFLGPCFATAQRLVSVRMRAMASAVLMFFLQGLGVSIGPVAAGAISDALRPALGAESLRYALLTLSGALLIAGVLFALGARWLRADLAAADAAFGAP